MEKVVMIKGKSSEKKYKCPYCEARIERSKMYLHIESKHEKEIPPGYTARRVAFNTVNNKETGHCIMCGKETKWNEEKCRYERLCSKECEDAYKKMCAERNRKKYGTDRLQSDPRYKEEVEKKALEGRRISGKYMFMDGGEIKYVGSYEKKFLEFMDKVMEIESVDLQAPGPSFEYTFNGENKLYISDFYYVPYNLIIEVKDGGDNPNKNPEVAKYKEGMIIAKEAAVKLSGKYNYIRLTNNQFAQLMVIMADLKFDMMNDCYDPIMMINEACESLEKARELCSKVRTLAKEYDANFYFVTDGASSTNNSGNKAVKVARDAVAKWEDENGYDSKEDWSKNESTLLESSECDKRYDPPYTYDEIVEKYGKETADKLMKDPVHKWRAETGIELIHKEPTLEEFNRIWKNWNYMSDIMKKKSDKKSIELFGIDNKKNREKLLPEYSINESSDESHLEKNHKTKTGINFKFLSLDEALKDKAVKNDEKWIHKIEWYASKKYGIVAIDPKANKPAGYICVSKTDTKPYGGKTLSPLYVEEEYRGYGLSDRLMKDCIDKWDPVVLGVYTDNEVAIRLYKKYGFKIDHTETYKDGTKYYIMVRKKTHLNESTLLEGSYDYSDYKFIDQNDEGAQEYAKNYKDYQKYKPAHIKDYVEFAINTKDNKIAGMIAVGKSGKNKGFIYDVDVVEKYRRQGLGTKLVKDAISKYGGIDLVVDKDNYKAIALYRKLNFIIIGEAEEGKPGWWMKLKSKLTKDDKVIPFEETLNESYIVNEKDIYYNKNKFDSGEINLCFITGHSGSGKSTMGREMQKSGIEHYELDDLQCIKDHFTMANLKEYGDLIYSYFNGEGKKFYLSLNEIKEKNLQGDQYEDQLFPGFVHYAMKYAKAHKDKRFVIEGVWLFGRSEITKKPWFDPSEFKDYAFYIKGTSALISKLRGARRDAKEGYPGEAKVVSYVKQAFIYNWKAYYVYEKEINRFRDYFGKADKNMNEATMNENMGDVIGAALPPQTQSNCYIVNRMQNNVFSGDTYITEDPFQYTLYGIKKGKAYKVTKPSLGTKYTTFRILDTKRGRDLLDEMKNYCESSKCPVLSENYLYEFITGNKMLTEDQIMYDDRFELVKDFKENLQESCDHLYNYIMTGSIKSLEEQVADLEKEVL